MAGEEIKLLRGLIESVDPNQGAVTEVEIIRGKTETMKTMATKDVIGRILIRLFLLQPFRLPHTEHTAYQQH